MTNCTGSLRLQDFTAMPPDLLTSSAKTSVILRQRSASEEKEPVSLIVVPQTIGPSHEFSLAAAGWLTDRAMRAALATRVRFMLVSWLSSWERGHRRSVRRGGVIRAGTACPRPRTPPPAAAAAAPCPPGS